MKDIRQTSEYSNYLADLGWIVEQKGDVYFFIKKLPLIGSFMKVQRPEQINLDDINSLQKMYRVFQTIIEPKDSSQEEGIANNGFKQSKSPFLPSKTLILDLSTDLEKSFKKDTKYALRKTKEIKMHEEKDIEKFRRDWKKSVPFSRYVPSLSDLLALKKAFGNKSLFLEYESNAGAIFLIGNKTCYYWLAFTDKNARKKLVQYKIVWEGIQWGKKIGAKLFDFEGIYDERFPIKTWKGFTHFKKSFDGKEVEYPGAFKKKWYG